MSSVSEIIVREYFEMHGFLVRQQRKFIAPSKNEDEEIDFLVINPQPQAGQGGLDFVLGAAGLPGVAKAVVAVKGWHTETISSGVVAHAEHLARFAEPSIFRHAVKALGGEPAPLKVLVVPSLPQAPEARAQSIAALQAKGVDAVLPFRTMLQELIDQVEVNRNYAKSDLLQILRILKNYEFFKEPQLELFKPRKQRRRRS